VIAILIDFGAAGFPMAVLGEQASILYVTFPWVIIGNGFRYGRRYLHLAQGLALATFGAVVMLNPFWRQYPTLSAALVLVLIMVPGYAGMLISRVHAARRRVEEARGEAEAANLAKSRFLAAASHDLRQPMQALSLYSSALAGDSTPRDAARILQGIQLSVQTLEQMFDGLLDIARLESGVIAPRIAAFPLLPLLERIAEAERPLAAQKRIELRVAPTSASVLSDPVLLERMLKNLLTNAIRYTERGRIVLGCRRAGSTRVRVSVVDSGIGIPAHEQARIFDEYYQIAGASAQGLGLGLPIVKSLGDLLGHGVAVKSAPGRGSAFSIELERAQARAADPVRPAPADLAGIDVALVDDDIEIRQSMRALLESWGCRCISAATGAEVESRLHEQKVRPAALIVDYRLAEAMNGLQVIERLREAFDSALPALLITGTPNAPALLAPGMPGVALAVKPVPPGKLRAFLSSTARNQGRSPN
jgi:signal transduction histidine kinase/CheY-like chemotaxis protein